MKNFMFWKHEFELFIAPTLFLTFSFIILIFGIIISIKEKYFNPLIPSGVMFLILTIIGMFYEKRILAKVIFSEQGIEWIWFKKRVSFINWEDVINVGPYIRGLSVDELAFSSKDTQIVMSLTKKKYKVIMFLCPREDIKQEINNIDCFKWYHRKEDKD